MFIPLIVVSHHRIERIHRLVGQRERRAAKGEVDERRNNAVGGAFGSVLRFLTSSWVVAQWPRHYYLATFAVNLVGCFLIGFLSAYFLLRSDLPLVLRTGLTVGVLGGLTTFSSFSLEVLRLLEAGQFGVAAGYLLSSVVGGLLAAWLGMSLARL